MNKTSISLLFHRCIDEAILNITSNTTYGESCTYNLPNGIEVTCSNFEFDKSLFQETVVTKVNGIGHRLTRK